MMPLLVAASAASAVETQGALGLGEEQYFDELPVVVSVTRLPQTPLELPASLTVIDRRMIEASGVNDIPELLRLAAGFQIAHVDGTKYVVTYHGMGDDYARRIQVLVDGRSVYLPATSSVDWFDLPLSLEDIDRIEVLRGPNGVAFGDNSFSGVVNIITQEAASARGSYARIQAGQGNYRRAMVRQGGKLGDLDLRLTLEHQSDDGLDDVVRDNGQLSSIRDDKLSNKMSLRGDWRAGVNDYVQFHGGLNSGTRGYGYNPSTTIPDAYALEPGLNTYNWRHFEQIKWRHIVSSDNELQVQLYHDYSDTRNSYQTQFPSPPQLQVVIDNLSERYALELEHRFRLSDSIRMVWGGEARYDQVTAPGFLNSEEPRHNQMYRGFAHTEWKPVQDYLINLGAMLEHNDIAGTHLSPRLALIHQFSADHAMRISATRAYRTPTNLEENANFSAKVVGDETQHYQIWLSPGNLQSEQITAYEIGWMGSLGTVRDQYDFKFFREEIRDDITTPMLPGYPSTIPVAGLDTSAPIYFINRDWADLKGAELQLKSFTSENTMFSFGYSYVYSDGIYTKRLYPDGTLDVRTITRNVPSHTFSWLTEHRFDSNWRGTVAFYHVDHIAFWYNYETSLNTVDARLARRFKSGSDEGELSIVARDITGEYYDFQYERVINPRIYLALDYRF